MFVKVDRSLRLVPIELKLRFIQSPFPPFILYLSSYTFRRMSARFGDRFGDRFGEASRDSAAGGRPGSRAITPFSASLLCELQCYTLLHNQNSRGREIVLAPNP